MNKEELREELGKLKIMSTELELRVETITKKMDEIYDAMIKEYGDIELLPTMEAQLLNDYYDAMDRIEDML